MNNKAENYFNMRSFILSALLLMLSGFNQLSAQVLISGTSFEPLPGNEDRFYISADDIAQVGIQSGELDVKITLAPDVDPDNFHSSLQYAITDNAIKLDSSRYVDGTLDYQLVFSPASTATRLLEYSVTGLVPGSDVEAVIEYCTPMSSTGVENCVGQRVSFKGGVNPQNDSENEGGESTQLETDSESCGTYSINSTGGQNHSRVVDANGEAKFFINSITHSACAALTIKSIMIYGEPLPVISAEQGDAVCVGEIITLQSSISYDATYQWQQNISGTWQDVSGANNSKYLFETPFTAGFYEFRLKVTSGSNEFFSESLTVEGEQCCEINGVPASRQTVFYDNFGRVDNSNTNSFYVWDYTDIYNPQEVLETTTTPSRRELANGPVGLTFAGTGPVPDGSYTVAANLLDADFGYWAHNVTGFPDSDKPKYGYDHSGEQDGAVLLINNNNNLGDVIYSQEFDNLCGTSGGRIFNLEFYLTVFTNGDQGADVTVNLYDPSNSLNDVSFNATAVKQGAVGNNGWTRFSSDILIEGSSLRMEIINNVANYNLGNDIAIDDIRISTCAPPSVNLFYDLTSLSTEENVCKDQLDLNVQVTQMLEDYYTNNQEYQFQWTLDPTDFTTWKYYGTPQSSSIYSIPDPSSDIAFSGLDNGDKVYFRVVVASPGGFPDEDDVNINNPCRNYSVSSEIEAVVACPSYVVPSSIVFTPASSNDLCLGGSQDYGATVGLGTSENGGYYYTWYKGGVVVDGPSTTYTDLSINSAITTDDDTYTLRVEDGNAGNASCYLEEDIIVNVLPAVVISSSLVEELCTGSALAYTITSGTVDATFTWSRASVTGITETATTGSTEFITETLTNTTTSPIDVTYVLTPTSPAPLSCVGTSSDLVVTVNPSPSAPMITDFEYCLGDGIDAITDNVTGTDLVWYETATTTVISVPVISTGTAGTTSYDVSQTVSGCESEVSTIDVVVNALPTVTVVSTPLDGEICLGEDVILTGGGASSYTWAASTVTSGSAFTGTITDGVAFTPIAAGEVAYEVTGVDANMCENTATVDVIVHALPTVMLSGGGEFCKEATPELTATFTGEPDFIVEYNIGGLVQGSLTLTSLSESISTVLAGNIIVGTYNITKVTDDNGCELDTLASAIVDTISDIIITNTDVTCDFGTNIATITYEVSGGEPSYSATTELPGAGMFDAVGTVYTASFLSATSVTYDYNVSDASKCMNNTDVDAVAGSINCNCPVKGELRLATGEPNEICAGDAGVTIEVEMSNSASATPDYAFELTTPSGTLDQTDATSVVGDIYSFTITEGGMYSFTANTVQDLETCFGTGENTVELTVNLLPVGMFDPIVDSICASDNINIPMTFSVGTAPFTYTIAGPDASGVLVAPPHNISTEGIYSLTTLVDDKGCEMEIPADAGTFTLTHFEEPIITAHAAICDDAGNTATEYNYSVELTADLGEESSYEVSLTLSDGAMITNAEGVWLGDTWSMTNLGAIEESISVTGISIKDANNCSMNTYTSVPFGITCSCPEIGTLELSTGSPSAICEEGAITTSELTMTLTPGPIAPADWAFAIQTTDGTVLPGQDYRTTRYAGPLTFTIPVSDSGTYEIVGLEGLCVSTPSSLVNVAYHNSPIGKINGDFKICADSTDTVDITIEIDNLTLPAEVVVERTVGGDTTIPMTSLSTTIQTLAANTYEISSITDANQCTAKDADKIGLATIDSVSIPSADIISVDGDDELDLGPGTTDEKLTNQDEVEVVAETITDAFTGTWILTGEGNTADIREYEVLVEGLTTIASSPDTAFGDAGVTQLIYAVQDTAGICDVVTDTLKIVRVVKGVAEDPYTIPLCEDYAAFTEQGQNPLNGVETVEWIEITGGVFGSANTVVSTTRDLNFPAGISPGTYLFEYRISNNIDTDIEVTVVTVQIDELPSTAALTVASPILTCDEEVDLTATTPTPSTATGVWTKVSGTGDLVTSEITQPNGTVNGLVEGQSGEFLWTVSNGVCIDKSDIAVTVTRSGTLTLPTLTVDGTPVPNGGSVDLCIDSIAVIKNIGYNTTTETGMWTIESGASVTITEDDSESQTMNLIAGGATVIKWEISDISGSGCEPINSEITVNVTEAPTVDIISITDALGSTPAEVCQGEEVTITIATTNIDPLLTTWNVGVIEINPTEVSPTEYTIQTTALGFQTVTLTAGNEVCGTISDMGTYTVNEVFEPSFDLIVIPNICEGESVTFELENTVDLDEATYSWSYVGTGIEGVTTNSTFEVTNLEAGIATATVEVTSTKACNVSGTEMITDSRSVEVEEKEIPSLEFLNDTTVCEDELVTLFAAVFEGNYQWYRDSVALVGETNPILEDIDIAGVYYMTETNDVCGERSTTAVEIIHDTIPNVDAGTYPPIEELQTVNLTGRTDADESERVILWSILTTDNVLNSDIIVDRDSLVTGLNTSIGTNGNYVIQLKVTQGECEKIDEAVILIREKLYAPNVFTPDGDGYNDLFKVKGIQGYPAATMSIYNRWGNRVFVQEGNYSGNEWDGGNVTEGVYYYILDLGTDNKDDNYTGAIHVMRK